MDSIIKSKALEELAPSAWVLDGDTFTILDGSIVVTEEEFVQKCAEVEYLQEVESYKKDRVIGYPPTGEQFDKIFHDGLDAWKEEIQAVKDAYPKAEIDEATLTSRKEQALFDYQSQEYRKALSRLAQYQLSVGRPEVTEMMPTGEQVFNEETGEMEDVLEEVIVQTAIEPLEPTVEITVYDEEDPMAEPTTETVPNPLIVADDAERAEAQTVIDNTPEPVKEHVDNE